MNISIEDADTIVKNTEKISRTEDCDLIQQVIIGDVTSAVLCGDLRSILENVVMDETVTTIFYDNILEMNTGLIHVKRTYNVWEVRNETSNNMIHVNLKPDYFSGPTLVAIATHLIMEDTFKEVYKENIQFPIMTGEIISLGYFRLTTEGIEKEKRMYLKKLEKSKYKLGVEESVASHKAGTYIRPGTYILV